MSSSAMYKEKLPEILAPAGSFDSVVAAVRCGADAVYLGAKQFSARASAQNFAEDELADTVAYCHERGVKVYLAVNTAIYDHELSAAAQLIESAAQIGVDALIVSDLGIISLAKKICPELPLHGSTQMGVASLAGADAAAALGLDRIVLARELSAKEIKEIAQNSKLEIEAFVHGAHCMCVSGQCYFSAMLGSRSGNRGRCAQPCRLDFYIDGSNAEYALSLKDISLAAHLKELADMGVASLKIEGRMKRPEYVASAVSLIRASLAGGKVDNSLYKLAEDIFSRSGFTDGYFKSEINGKMFGFRTRDNVESSKSALSSIHELYRRERQSVGVDLALSASSQKGITLTLQDADKNIVSARLDKNSLMSGQLDEQKACDNLSRLGSTPYFAKNIELDVENGITVAPSVLNALRREVAESLSKKRQEASARKIFKAGLPDKKIRSQREQKLYARFENAEQLAQNEKLCDVAVLPISELLNNMDAVSAASCKIVAELPRHAFSNDSIVEQQLKQLASFDIDTVCVQNIGQLSLVKPLGLKVMFGPFMNVFNSETLGVLEKNGIESAVASFELSEKSIRELSTELSLGALVYGHIPLMITRACPLKNKGDCKKCNKNGFLTDRTGRKMRVICRGAVSEIYNADVLAADLSQNKFDNVDFLLCYFTVESAKQCKNVLEGVKNNRLVPKADTFTRGLYKKGVI